MNNKFKRSTQQDLSKRTKLEDVIPLNTPLSMQIELSSACNFKCVYCLHSCKSLHETKFKLGTMKLDVFKKIVDDLQGFPNKLKFISLQSRGESFLNKDLVEMIKYLKEKDVTNEIAINTNASLLNPDINSQLSTSGLNYIRLSIQGVNSRQYKENSDVNVDFKDIVRNVSDLYNKRGEMHIYSKIIDINLTDEDKQEFIDVFAAISDSVYIERPIDFWPGVQLDVSLCDSRYGDMPKRVDVCPRIFFAMVAHFDGTVVACDEDWDESYPLGNVVSTSLVDIWNSERFNDLRVNHLLGKSRERAKCEKCSEIESCEFDNIDEHADALLRRFIF